MIRLIHAFLLCLVILVIGVGGRFAEITEDGLGDGVVSASTKSDESHHAGGNDGSGQVKAACHGAIGCHVMVVPAAVGQLHGTGDHDAYASEQDRASGILAFDHLRPPIELS